MWTENANNFLNNDFRKKRVSFSYWNYIKNTAIYENLIKIEWPVYFRKDLKFVLSSLFCFFLDISGKKYLPKYWLFEADTNTDTQKRPIQMLILQLITIYLYPQSLMLCINGFV